MRYAAGGGGGHSMENGNCSRYLGPTLLASASTFGLFAAANWGIALLIGNPFWKLIGDPPCCRGSAMRSFLAHCMFAFAMPLYPFFIALGNVLRTWEMRTSLAQRQDSVGSLDHDTIATMTTCPIFIKIPHSLLQNEELKSREYRILTNLDKFIRPSELPPARAEAVKCADCAAAVRENPGNNAVPPKSYILLSKARIKDLKEREVLLALRLVPEKEELQFLHSRRFFRTVVTMLQALGYTLGVLERLVARVGISPLEAILTFLCLLVTLQLLMELYVSGNYQRPLLLSLNDDQFSEFLEAPRSSEHNFRCFSDKLELILALLISLVMPAPFLYYALSFHLHSQYLCSLSAFLFFLVPPTTIVGSIVFRHRNLDESVPKNVAIHCECLLFTLSFVLAIIATVKHWEFFEKPSGNIFFQWILPHVAT